MSRGNQWAVYSLCEPVTGEIRYIGKARDPESRFKQHCGGANPAIGDWVKELAKSGHKPRLVVLSKFTKEADALEEERRLTLEFASRSKLLNKIVTGRLEPQLAEYFGCGGRIHELRKARHVSLRELAKAVGADATNLSRIERGVCEPGVTLVVRIAKALSTTVEHLVTGAAHV